MIFWGAFDSLLFADDAPRFDQFEVGAAMAVSNAEWSDEAVKTLLLGRDTYRSLLESLAVYAAEIQSMAMLGAKSHPLVYSTSKEAWR